MDNIIKKRILELTQSIIEKTSLITELETKAQILQRRYKIDN